MAAVRDFEFHNFFYKSACAHSWTKIWVCTPNFIEIGWFPTEIYSDKTIFKMAAVRHLEFSKFGILATWPVSERDSASSHKISQLSDNKSRRYSQKTIFNMAAVCHFAFTIFWYFVTWLSLKPKCAAAHQMSLKSDDPWLRYSDETIFKMASIRRLKFSKIVNLVTWPVHEHDCASTTKFCVNRTINRGE